MRNKTDELAFEEVARSLGLDRSEVRRCVTSYFDSIWQEARALPFNNARKIYSKEKFDSLVSILYIPCIGKLGPSYSRYKKWRALESKAVTQVSRGTFRVGLTQDEIEDIAADVLSGTIPHINKRKKQELYDRVWLVGTKGKKQARQVIPKQNV